jgi:hypothetical protein
MYVATFCKPSTSLDMNPIAPEKKGSRRNP